MLEQGEILQLRTRNSSRLQVFSSRIASFHFTRGSPQGTKNVVSGVSSSAIQILSIREPLLQSSSFSSYIYTFHLTFFLFALKKLSPHFQPPLPPRRLALIASSEEQEFLSLLIPIAENPKVQILIQESLIKRSLTYKSRPKEIYKVINHIKNFQKG